MILFFQVLHPVDVGAFVQLLCIALYRLCIFYFSNFSQAHLPLLPLDRFLKFRSTNGYLLDKPQKFNKLANPKNTSDTNNTKPLNNSNKKKLQQTSETSKTSNKKSYIYIEREREQGSPGHGGGVHGARFPGVHGEPGARWKAFPQRPAHAGADLWDGRGPNCFGNKLGRHPTQ